MSVRFVAIFICFLMTAAQLSVDIYLPSFPAMEVALSTTSTHIQLTFALFLAAFGGSQLFYGPLADRYGRKPVLIAGVSLFLVMSILCVFIQSIEWLIFIRILQGVGCGVCSVVPRAIMKDIFTGMELQKINLYQSMAWSIVPILAPLLGSYIQAYLGWRYSFGFIALFAAVSFCLVVFFYKETLKEKSERIAPSHVITDYAHVFLNIKFWPYLVCAMASIGLLDSFAVASPLLIQEKLGLSVMAYGWSIFFVAMSFVVGIILNRLMISKFCDTAVIFFGFCSAILSVLILFLSIFLNYQNLYFLLGSAAFAQISIAFIFATCATNAIDVFPGKAGKAAALFGCACLIGGTFSSVAMSYLPNEFIYLFIIFLINTVVMGFGYLVIKKYTLKFKANNPL